MYGELRADTAAVSAPASAGLPLPLVPLGAISAVLALAAFAARKLRAKSAAPEEEKDTAPML